VLAGVGMASVRAELSRATAQAAHAGVSDVPALRVGQRVFVGERAVDDAVTYMQALALDPAPAPADLS